MEVNKALVNLKLVAVPGLGTLTTRLHRNINKKDWRREHGTHSLTGGNLENLGGQTDGSFDTELLVLGTVDEVVRDYTNNENKNTNSKRVPTLFQVLDIAARQRDTDFVDFSGGHRGTGSIVFFFSFSDVAHDCR